MFFSLDLLCVCLSFEGINIPRGRISIPLCHKLLRVKLVGPGWLFGVFAGRVLLELTQ